MLWWKVLLLAPRAVAQDRVPQMPNVSSCKKPLFQQFLGRCGGCHSMPRDATGCHGRGCACSMFIFFFGSGKMSIIMVTGNVLWGVTQIMFPKRHERWKTDIVRRKHMDMGVCCLNLTCYNRVICFEHDWAHLQSTITNYTQSVIPGHLGELIGGVVIVRWWHLTSCDFNKQACCRVWPGIPDHNWWVSRLTNRIWFFCVLFRKLLIFRTIYLQIWWYIYIYM